MRTIFETTSLALGIGIVSAIFQPVIASNDSHGQLDDSALLALEGTSVPGQQGNVDAAAVEALVTQTTLTYRSHSVAAGASAGNLEGNACPASYTMISGACHPGYNDRMVIINQYPNKGGNTWRCGFKNNNAAARTIWVYTLCGK